MSFSRAKKRLKKLNTPDTLSTLASLASERFVRSNLDCSANPECPELSSLPESQRKRFSAAAEHFAAETSPDAAEAIFHRVLLADENSESRKVKVNVLLLKIFFYCRILCKNIFKDNNNNNLYQEKPAYFIMN